MKTKRKNDKVIIKELNKEIEYLRDENRKLYEAKKVREAELGAYKLLVELNIINNTHRFYEIMTRNIK